MKCRNSIRITGSFLLLVLLLFYFLYRNAASGSVMLSASQVLRVLLGKGDDAMARSIILTIRLPRLLAAAILGGALAVSGYLMQTFFRNPIAGPFVLGISSGAKFTVSLCMIFVLGSGTASSSAVLVLAASIGAMMTMGLVLLLSLRVKNMSLLVVCGVMVGYICTALTDFLVTFAEDSNIVNLHNWSKGSFSGISWESVQAMGVICTVVMISTVFLIKPISAYQLGEGYAGSMGLNVRLFRVALILLSSILAACVTAFAGPVSFVGIAVPHLVKQLFRTSRPGVLLPACFLGGSVFCLVCDLIARTAFAPLELSISSVTAAFGAPVVIYMMVSRKRNAA